MGDAAEIRSQLQAQLSGDPAALKIALALYEDLGDIVSVEPEQDMDGGWRGQIHLVPEPPIDRYRRHLEWVAAARRAIDRFMIDLAAGQSATPNYRVKPLTLAFMRSVAGKRTPSAFAYRWTIAYNVVGSLFGSADAVRETLFHETFHLNDQAHGDWSQKLAPIYEAIMKRCDVEAHVVASLSCLRPYAPSDTTVLGGTYYAFQPGGGVGEYAAELAVRYYKEQLAALASTRSPARGGGVGWGRTKTPFKCGPEENARAWRLLIDEFFAGIDIGPACR